MMTNMASSFPGATDGNRWDLFIRGTGKPHFVAGFNADQDVIDYVDSHPELKGENLAVRSGVTFRFYPYVWRAEPGQAPD